MIKWNIVNTTIAWIYAILRGVNVVRLGYLNGLFVCLFIYSHTSLCWSLSCSSRSGFFHIVCLSLIFYFEANSKKARSLLSLAHAYTHTRTHSHWRVRDAHTSHIRLYHIVIKSSWEIRRKNSVLWHIHVHLRQRPRRQHRRIVSRTSPSLNAW